MKGNTDPRYLLLGVLTNAGPPVWSSAWLRGWQMALLKAFQTQAAYSRAWGYHHIFPCSGRKQNQIKAHDNCATSLGSLLQPYNEGQLAESKSRCRSSFEYYSGEVLESRVRKEAEASRRTANRRTSVGKRWGLRWRGKSGVVLFLSEKSHALV